MIDDPDIQTNRLRSQQQKKPYQKRDRPAGTEGLTEFVMRQIRAARKELEAGDRADKAHARGALEAYELVLSQISFHLEGNEK